MRKDVFTTPPLTTFRFFADSLPVLDVSAMKHIAYVFDALIYFLRNATTQSVTDETAPDSRPSSVDESFAPVNRPNTFNSHGTTTVRSQIFCAQVKVYKYLLPCPVLETHSGDLNREHLNNKLTFSLIRCW